MEALIAPIALAGWALRPAAAPQGFAPVESPMREYSVLSLFAGAGGLDLGFEAEGFRLAEAIDHDPWCVATLRRNRPRWRCLEADVRDYSPDRAASPDVLLAGVPCQGFSLGGGRDGGDPRNILYRQVVRIAREAKPRAVVLENVLNLCAMRSPETGEPFAAQIAGEFEGAGYRVSAGVLRACRFGVPQTRRRFILVALAGAGPAYRGPRGGADAAIRPFLHDLAHGGGGGLPNHDPAWGLRSAVHVETGEPFDPGEEIVPVRLSRTASDGHPVRSHDAPFPAVDTGTVWGWAQGNVRARRFRKNRDPKAAALWRVRASRLRAFTIREYARLQTFPDDWEFVGPSKSVLQTQVGNAVPVALARRVAQSVRAALEAS